MMINTNIPPKPILSRELIFISLSDIGAPYSVEETDLTLGLPMEKSNEFILFLLTKSCAPA
jgi:hypothetical protein